MRSERRRGFGRRWYQRRPPSGGWLRVRHERQALPAPSAGRARQTPWSGPWPGIPTGFMVCDQMRPQPARGLRDRLSELETLEQLLNDARNGRSAVVVVRGEAGIGKSALLRAVVDDASGFRVARIGGVESEMELPFAGLHQLCAPLLDQARRPAAAPETCVAGGPWARLRDSARPFPRRARGADPARRVAEEQPFLCFVDDAQWLDDASRQVLGFVARRLLAEPVAIVFSVREPNDDAEFAGLPELPLDGLERGERALAARHGHPRSAG